MTSREATVVRFFLERMDMAFIRFSAVLLITLLLVIPAHSQENAYTTLTRAAFFVAEPDSTITFYKVVLGYEEGTTARDVGPYPADNAWGIPEGSHLRLTYLKSRDGAYVAVMGLEDSELESLTRPPGATNAYGDVMLIHLVNNIDEVHARATAGGYDVIKPPTLSTSGTSKQMFLRDPNGIRIELNEILSPPTQSEQK
jgi:catechol 2,3-dioxygenase-like lactoylglutathione lyase family enzyme